MGLKDFLSRFKKRRDDEAARPEPEPRKALASLDIADPLAYAAAESLFPLSFSVGAVPVRARAVRLEAGADAFYADDPGPWFVWKADTPDGRLVGYWHLPGPRGDAATEAAWGKAAASIALAAAARHKESLSSRMGLSPAGYAAGPCAAPALRGRPVVRLDFDYAARGVFRRGRAYASAGYPSLVAAKAGCPDGLSGYPIEALAAASEAMNRASPELPWAPRAFSFPAASGPRTYLPVYELFNLLSDDDLRLVIQNNVVLNARGTELGALFLYRSPSQAGSGVARRVIGPHSLDRSRVDALFPASAREEGWLSADNAAEGVDAFLERNDAAYESLFKALRKDALALSENGARLVREVYVAAVYAAKRRALDAAVKDGKPFDVFIGAPKPLARRAVDSSGPRMLAAFAYGSPEALAYLSPWCSRGKLEGIAYELKAMDAALAGGTADIGAIVKDRFAIMDTLKRVSEAEAREREAARRRGDTER